MSERAGEGWFAESERCGLVSRVGTVWRGSGADGRGGIELARRGQGSRDRREGARRGLACRGVRVRTGLERRRGPGWLGESGGEGYGPVRVGLSICRAPGRI